MYYIWCSCNLLFSLQLDYTGIPNLEYFNQYYIFIITGEVGDFGDEGEQGPPGLIEQRSDYLDVTEDVTYNETKGDSGPKGEKGYQGNKGEIGYRGVMVSRLKTFKSVNWNMLIIWE